MIGQVLKGRYELLDSVGAGRFTTVYRARDLRSGALVAVKVLHPRPDADPAFRRRFAREAELTPRLGHPNVVDVLDYVVEDDLLALVTEYVAGHTLAEALRQRGPLPIPVATWLAEQVLAGLEAAHAAGLLHGDLTPSNLILTVEGMLKVTDFGIARRAAGGDVDDADLTLGAAEYVAPEIVLGEPADARSDLYALGVTLYECLAGRVPFQADSPLGVIHQQIHAAPPPLSPMRPDAPAALVSAIERALAKRPEDRFQSAGEMLHALELARASAESLAEQLGPGPDDEQGDAPRRYLDQDVQFTVYRPRAVRPATWYPLLAFAHLSTRPPDAAEDEPDPVEEVRRQAEQVLGEWAADYQRLTQDSRQAVPREGELTFVPEVPGVEFNPPRRTFRWRESVHREEFRLLAHATLDGQSPRGRLTVLLGSLILAEVSLSIRVDSSQPVDPRAARPLAQSARPYRKLFACYAHRDVAIVEEVERYALATGDQYLRDVLDLRAGEVWDARLMQLIGEADVFQLFWSSNAMRSPYVRQECDHALSLKRAGFIRPVYWEEPLPQVPDEGLPPRALSRLHFTRIYPARAPAAAPPQPGGFAPPATAPPAAYPGWDLAHPHSPSDLSCRRCGAALRSGAWGCGVCGTPAEGPPATAPTLAIPRPRAPASLPRPSEPAVAGVYGAAPALEPPDPRLAPGAAARMGAGPVAGAAGAAIVLLVAELLLVGSPAAHPVPFAAALLGAALLVLLAVLLPRWRP